VGPPQQVGEGKGCGQQGMQRIAGEKACLQTACTLGQGAELGRGKQLRERQDCPQSQGARPEGQATQHPRLVTVLCRQEKGHQAHRQQTEHRDLGVAGQEL
jgi:hypothetical protein